MKARHFKTFEEFDYKPGSYVFNEGSDGADLFMTLPCGHNFKPDGRWQVKDLMDPEKITLTPSIFCSPQVPCWHGYLTNGEFIKV